MQHLFVPAGVERELVVRDDQRAALGFREMPQDDHGNLGHAKLASGKEARVARNHIVVGPHQDGIRPPPLANRRGDLRDLLGSVRTRIRDSRNQSPNRPSFHLNVDSDFHDSTGLPPSRRRALPVRCAGSGARRSVILQDDFAQVIQDNHRHRFQAQLESRQVPAMPGDDVSLGIDQNRRIESGLRNVACSLCGLRVRVAPGIPGIRNEFVNWPELDALRRGMCEHTRTFQSNQLGGIFRRGRFALAWRTEPLPTILRGGREFV